MSDSLVVLIDHAATAEEAATVGTALIDALIAEGFILPTPDSSCVLMGEGYPPGPRLNEIYRFQKNELRYWDTLTNCGVKLRTERYVNFWAFPVFETAHCPGCQAGYRGNAEDDDRFFDSLYECVASFVNEGTVPDVYCPTCNCQFPGRQWKCIPDVGLSYVALEFWNWPSFSATGWSVFLPDLITARTNRSLAVSWGRL